MAWLSGWSYRKEISITGQSGAGTNYQVKFDVGDSAGGDFHLEGHCTDFPQDIEVTDNDGTTLLDFWIEDITADPLKMWIKVADDLGSNQTIYIYYGKSGATTDSDIANTFIYGEDFEWSDAVTNHGWTIESGSHVTSTNQAKSGARSLYVGNGSSGGLHTSTNWITDNVILELDFYDTHPAGDTNSLFIGISDGSNYNAIVADTTDDNYYRLRYGAANYVASTVGRSIGWHTTKQIHTTNGDIDSYIDDVFITQQTNVVPTAYIRPYAYDDLYVDNIHVRKYNSPEPAFSSAGSEETPPTIGHPWYYERKQ